MARYLWHIKRNNSHGYDEYSDFVVVAETRDEATHYHPNSSYFFVGENLQIRLPDGTIDYAKSRFDGWTTPAYVSAERLGIADPGLQSGRVICASFHAG